MSSEEENRFKKRLICRRGSQKMSEKKFKEALDLFTKAIELDPKDWRIFVNRSYCSQQLNQLEDALRDANSAIDVNESNIAGHYRKGCVLLAKRQFRSAEESLKLGLKLDPNDKDLNLKVRETHELFLKEFGFVEPVIKQLMQYYDSCDQLSDALITGQLIQKLSECHIECNSSFRSESPEVSALMSMSSNTDIYSNVSQILEYKSGDEELNDSVDHNIPDLISHNTAIKMDDNRTGIRIPKSVPFLKRSSMTPTISQQMNSTEEEVKLSPNNSSNESTPKSKTMIKTRPMIRIKSSV